jgi:hypothetical protein
MKPFKHNEAVIFGTSVFLLAGIVTAYSAAAVGVEPTTTTASATSVDVETFRAKNLVAVPALLPEVKNSPEKKLKSYSLQRDRLTDKELKELLSLVGFEGQALKTAWAIVMKESTGRPTSHNKNSNTGDNSYGLFQINMIGGLGEDRRNKFKLEQNEELFNPVRNAEIAYHMSGKGEDFGAWGLGPNAYNGGKAGSYYEWLAKYPKE